MFRKIIISALLLMTPIMTACTAQPAPTPTATPAPTTEAAQSDTVTAETALSPVYADSLKNGSYTVTVDSSSSMFRIVDCMLTVENGQMSAEMTMGGTGYLKVYMGTIEEAEKAPDSDCIPFNELPDGAHSFTVPVEALDKPIDCAAFSKKKETWYDRTLVFRADSLPAEAFSDGYFVTAEALGLSDGEYSCAVSLSGGSGRASIQSPAALRVENGEVFASILWSSSSYDYMRIGDERYDALSNDGGSLFEIPVAYFDRPISVAANTTAMSTPHEIEYSLCFDSESIE